MALLSYREALGRALSEEMTRDSDVFLMGEEVALYNGAYKVSKGLLEKFGSRRVWDTPISEAGFTGLGVGAAMVGLRPVIELMTWNFGIQAFDQIINHAAKITYMSAGQFSMPIVFRGPNGPAHMLAATHSQDVGPLISNVPGLKIISHSCPYDGYGLLKSAIRDNNPVVFFESEMTYGEQQEIPDEEFTIPIGVGEIKRRGETVTVVAWNRMVSLARQAAEKLNDEGIDVEIIDPRTLKPLDEELIFKSVKKTNRLVIIEQANPFASISSEISFLVQKNCFDFLDAPIARVTLDDVPMPYNEHLEHLISPSEEKLIAAIKSVCYR